MFWEKISISIILILCSAVGLSIKGLFLYFLQYKAPKSRPINTLMWFDQVRYFLKNIKMSKSKWEIMLQLIHLVLGLFYSIFTILPIVFQTPLYEYIGTFGCYGFWFIQVIDGHAHVIFGFGMAIYRLICFENLLMKSLLKKLLIKRILIAESLAIFSKL